MTRTLRVQHNAARWAVVGFSEGGTCAADLVLAHPNVFHHFVDLAGDAKPTLGNAEHTRSELFGGDEAAMGGHDPARLLATHRYKGLTAWFVAGVDDRAKLDVSRRLAALAPKAGLKARQFGVPGGHNWQFASGAFARVLPDLCGDLGLH